MSPDVLANIIKPLYSTKGFGTGLDLSLAKQILLQHRVGIEIESREEMGTELTYWLPSGSDL